MRIHHIGYLVKNIEKALDEFLSLGYEIENDVVVDEIRKIKIVFLIKDNVIVELVAATEKDSVVSNLFKKIGSSPYHICYECESLQMTMDDLQDKGYIVIQEPEVAPAIDCKKVAFLYNHLIGMVELVEK